MDRKLCIQELCRTFLRSRALTVQYSIAYLKSSSEQKLSEEAFITEPAGCVFDLFNKAAIWWGYAPTVMHELRIYYRGNDSNRGNKSTQNKTSPIITFFTKYLAMIGLGSNQGLSAES